MRRLPRSSFLVATLAALLLVANAVQPSGASTPLGQVAIIATAGTTTGFDGASTPRGITVGPDGLLWFVDFTSVNRVNADGTVTSFDAVGTFGADPSLNSIVTGPDGNLWFTKFNPPGQIGKITPTGTMTAVTSFTTGNVEDIIVGPDNNLWYTKPFDSPGDGKIGRITTAGVTTEFNPPNASPQPRYLTVGSDGNIWFTDDGGGQGSQIGSILKTTTAGAITLVAQSGVTAGFGGGFFGYELTTGPDGNVWVPINSIGGSAVARVTPAGAVTEFAQPGTGDLFDIRTACGSLYITQRTETNSAPAVWQLTTAGAFTELATGWPAAASLQRLTVGADDDLKITDAGDPGHILNMGTACQAATTTTTTAVTTTTVAPATTPSPVAASPSFTG